MHRLLLLPVLLFCLACGDDERAPNLPPSEGGTGGSSGSAGRAGDDAGGNGNNGGTAGTSGNGGDAGDGTMDGPRVQLLSPEPVNDPADGGILLDDRLVVVCEVLPADVADTAPVIPGTVMIRVVGGDGSEVTSPLVEPSDEDPNRYEAEFILPTEAHGALTVLCSAEDTLRRRSEHQVATFYDAGPEIVIGEPGIDSAHALEDSIPFSFQVSPQPLGPGDEDAAAVSSVRLFFAGVEVEDVVEATPGVYSGSVDLSNRSLFPTPPVDTVAVEIHAVNSREPDAREAVRHYSFEIDDDGPEIAFVSPEPDEIVSGQVELVFTIEDDAGVDLDSLVVIVNSTEEFPFDPDLAGIWLANGNTYTLRFDTTNPNLDSGYQLSVEVMVSDRVGNETVNSIEFFLDNRPPFVHLDPAPVREFSDDGRRCSLPFDPLGLAADHRQHILLASRFRALVWDQTNDVASNPPVTGYISGTNEDSVTLFVRTEIGAPILADRSPLDDDDSCNAIVDEPEVASNRLGPVSPDGTAPSGPSPGGPACEATMENTPRRVCDNHSDMHRVISHSDDGQLPAVFASGALDPDAVDCTGTSWQIGALVGRGVEGWVCLAAEAQDNMGNYAVSPPIAVCVSDGEDDEPLCVNGQNPPSCTDGCTPREENSPAGLIPSGSTWSVALEP